MELQSKLIFPNPFKPVGIEFTLEVDALVTLEILDENGRVIVTPLVQQRHEAGLHTLEMDVRETMQARFYRLSAQSNGKSFTETKRLVIAK